MSTANGSDDPVIRQFRDQISDNDLKIVELINRRIRLVDQLWRYKAQKGIELFNPEREQWMLTYVTRANKGPLSAEALREVYQAIVKVSHDEARRLGAG